MDQPLNLDFILGIPLKRRGPAITAARIAEAMHGPTVQSQIFAPLDKWDPPEPSIPTRAGPFGWPVLRKIPYGRSRWLTQPAAERRLLRAATAAGGGRHVAYTWSEVTLQLAHRLKEAGIPVVREKTNCGKHVSREILDQAYGMLGLLPSHSITDELVEKEAEELELADGIYCPNEEVAKSLLAIGIDEGKLMRTSYGWDPDRFTETRPSLEQIDDPTFLFVGYLCVRKGAHILLEAWKASKSPGRLVIVGDIEPVIQERFSDELNGGNVLHLPFTDNIAGVYRSADWFVFPTLEEGGPQVTYEAGGCGVPGLVSAMGAGAFTRDGVEGVVVPSDDPMEWAESISRAARCDHDERERLGNLAKVRSLDFTWEQVGAQRVELLHRMLSE